MTEAAVDAAALWADARLSVELFAVDPFALGGMALRAPAGPVRDRVSGWLRRLIGDERPLLRLPLHVTVDRLLGGLDLAATLRAGRVVGERGLLSQAHGGALLAAMAERLEAQTGSHLCAALDRGELRLERDGLTAAVPCRLGVVALDEGIDEERPPAALRDRLALHLDLHPLGPRSLPAAEPDPGRVARARRLLPAVAIDDETVAALCQAAEALGIASLRAPLLAATTARVHAALAGRSGVTEDDAAVAARLVLGPRATRLPPETDESEGEPPADREGDPEPSADAAPAPPSEGEDEADQRGEASAGLDDIVLAAARSAIPSGLLDALALGRAPRSAPPSAGQAGALRSAVGGGRPAGTRPGQPLSGERLNVVETLRAAAPWQPLRRRERGGASLPGGRRVDIRRDDFRVTRFKQKTETSVIFSVDASGSSAMQRLAEAKGAVEQVLADCYVRRDHVALIAFRGAAATLLLPPTRSLVRVRRSLADLPGGGTTPLAAGIDAALALALESRQRGRTPVLVLMTDAHANVARDGSQGRPAALADALAAARAVRAAAVRALFLDTAPRPRPPAQALAEAMGARYLPLPYLDAAGISRQVQSLAGAP